MNARRDQLVIDAIRGLGEALVSGHATPDHWVLGRDGAVVESDVQGSDPVLSDADRAALHVAEAAADNPVPKSIIGAINRYYCITKGKLIFQITQIQRNTFPDVMPQVPGYEFAARYESSAGEPALRPRRDRPSTGRRGAPTPGAPPPHAGSGPSPPRGRPR